jgi:hypothetical protein
LSSPLQITQFYCSFAESALPSALLHFLVRVLCLVSAVYRATLTSHLLARLLFLLTCLSTPLLVSTFLSCPPFLVYRHDSWRLCRPAETSLLSLSSPEAAGYRPPSHLPATELVSHISSLAHSVGEKGEGTFTSQKAHTPLLRERGGRESIPVKYIIHDSARPQ